MVHCIVLSLYRTNSVTNPTPPPPTPESLNWVAHGPDNWHIKKKQKTQLQLFDRAASMHLDMISELTSLEFDDGDETFFCLFQVFSWVEIRWLCRPLHVSTQQFCLDEPGPPLLLSVLLHCSTRLDVFEPVTPFYEIYLWRCGVLNFWAFSFRLKNLWAYSWTALCM